MKRVCIIGGSGHAKVVADVIENMAACGCDVSIEGFLDDDENKKQLLGYSRIGAVSRINELAKDPAFLFIIGIGDNATRKKITSQYEIRWFTAVHPSAIVSRHAKVGKGTVIMAGVIINSDAIIGNHAIINTGAIVEHECHVEDFVHISPNATLCGNVIVGQCTHVGSGSTIIQNKIIGSGVTIGAGAVVVNNIPDNITVKGVPAR